MDDMSVAKMRAECPPTVYLRPVRRAGDNPDEDVSLFELDCNHSAADVEASTSSKNSDREVVTELPALITRLTLATMNANKSRPTYGKIKSRLLHPLK